MASVATVETFPTSHTEEQSEQRKPNNQESTTIQQMNTQPTETSSACQNLVFPTIYFGFDSTSIGNSEQVKLQGLLETLQQNPDAKITITGWCDAKGSKAVNARYSLRRAEAVKMWLVENGIASERINTKGIGSDYNQPDAAKARRADTTDNKQEGVL